MKKRGISTIIGAVLVISITLFLAVIVFSMIKSFLIDKTRESELEILRKEICEELDFSVEDVCRYRGRVINVDTEKIQESLRIKFLAGNNDLNVEIYSFDVFVDYEGGSFKVPSLDKSNIESLKSEIILSDNLNFEGNIEQIRIMPKIYLEESIFSCEEREEIVNNIVECVEIE